VKIRDEVPKRRGNQRTCSAEDTYAKVRPLFRDIGITRVSDITGLDRIGIPVYNAIVPRSREDLSVYSGKGLTPFDSKVSAVMEAVERNIGLVAPLRPSAIASYEELASEGRRVVRPRDINLELAPSYRDGVAIHWVSGFDMVREEAVLVPYSAVGLAPPPGAPPCYRVVTANGLASGNCIEEAICHGLAEVIERDAQTFAELLSSRLPYVLELGVFGPRPPESALSALQARHPHVDMTTLPPAAQTMIERFARAGVDIQVCSITSDLGVAAILAVSREDNGSGMSQAHVGMGACPNAEVAALRAITECAQSRAVDIQAMREDFVASDASGPGVQLYGKRLANVNTTAWPWVTGGKTVSMKDIPSHESDDVVSDLRFLLGRLKAAGLSRVVVVDMSPAEFPVKIARVVVPGLESWGSDRSKLGPRATGAWNASARAAMARAA
jgi:ribosomal protein S12 methylthiotransferase accessory factor